MKIGFIKFGCVMTLDPASWGTKGGENCPVAVLKRLANTGHEVTLMTKLKNEKRDGQLLAQWNVKYAPASLQRLAEYEKLDCFLVFGGPHFGMQHRTMMGRRYCQQAFRILEALEKPWLYTITDHRYYPHWFEP